MSINHYIAINNSNCINYGIKFSMCNCIIHYINIHTNINNDILMQITMYIIYKHMKCNITHYDYLQ